jgi:hypothetical protein
MKFLVNVTPRRTMIPPPAVIEHSGAWIKNVLANKTADCCYAFVTGGGVGIFNADSAETLLKIIMSYPAYTFVDFKIEPLCDIAVALDQVHSMVQRAASAQ